MAVITTIVLSISYQAFAKFRKMLSQCFLKQLAKSWKNCDRAILLYFLYFRDRDYRAHV